MCKDIRNTGFVYPILNCIFRCLERISILYWLNKKGREKSLALVDSYVFCWFIFFSIISILFFNHWSSFKGEHWPHNFVIVLILMLAIYRFVDIMEAWWNRYFVPPFKVSAPRNIVLTFMNYWEIIIVFAIVGLVFQCPPYYNEVQNWPITTALRASLRIATPLGLTEEPPVLWPGLVFYFEYAFGFVFLTVFMSVVLSYLRNNGKTDTGNSSSRTN